MSKFIKYQKEKSIIRSLCIIIEQEVGKNVIRISRWQTKKVFKQLQISVSASKIFYNTLKR